MFYYSTLSPEPLTAVYVIGDETDGPCKVGISRNPWKRLAQLKTGHHRRLRLYGVYWMATRQTALAAEAAVKAVYAAQRLAGEWYSKPTLEMAVFVPGIISIKVGREALLCYSHAEVRSTPEEEAAWNADIAEQEAEQQ